MILRKGFFFSLTLTFLYAIILKVLGSKFRFEILRQFSILRNDSNQLHGVIIEPPLKTAQLEEGINSVAIRVCLLCI